MCQVEVIIIALFMMDTLTAPPQRPLFAPVVLETIEGRGPSYKSVCGSAAAAETEAETV